MYEYMREIGRVVPDHRLPTQLEVDEMVRRAQEDHAQAIKEAMLEAGAAIAGLAGRVAGFFRRERGGRFSRA
ncbi:MAG TPA: hypothetical protein VLW45_02215 [Pelomicrobium sp.]|nr:hypothetical protein [Pelomicrobium sp.]